MVRKIGEVTAIEVRASGIHYDFAPCVAVSSLFLSFHLVMDDVVRLFVTILMLLFVNLLVNAEHLWSNKYVL